MGFERGADMSSPLSFLAVRTRRPLFFVAILNFVLFVPGQVGSTSIHKLFFLSDSGREDPQLMGTQHAVSVSQYFSVRIRLKNCPKENPKKIGKAC